MRSSRTVLATSLLLASLGASTFAGAQVPATVSVLKPSQIEIGATVFSRDGALAGAVDNVLDPGTAQERIVIGLAGYLGVGEKDVAIPARDVEQMPLDRQPVRHDVRGLYGGSTAARIKVPRSLTELTAAPAYESATSSTGEPSPHVGTPAEPNDKPPSSTQSGGPG